MITSLPDQVIVPDTIRFVSHVLRVSFPNSSAKPHSLTNNYGVVSSTGLYLDLPRVVLLRS